MKNLKLTSVICGGILSLAGNSLFAQTSTTDPSSAAQPSSGISGQSSTSSSAYGASGAMRSGNDVRLSQIMNANVQSHDGKTLGHIRDFTLDPQTGRIEFAILSLASAGGSVDTSTSGRETVPSSRSSVTGIPSSTSGYSTTGKLIPVPWQLFSQSWNSSQTGSSSSSVTGNSMGSQPLVLNIDESKLRTAPSFDASNWNDLQGGTLDQRVYSYFGVDRSSATGTSGSSISGQGTSGSRGSSSLPDSTTTPKP